MGDFLILKIVVETNLPQVVIIMIHWPGSLVVFVDSNRQRDERKHMEHPKCS